MREKSNKEVKIKYSPAQIRGKCITKEYTENRYRDNLLSV